MALSFAVVCEAKADYEMGCGLADALFRATLKLSKEALPARRAWRGLDPTSQFIKWTEVKDLVANRLSRLPGHALHGHFDGKPGAHDAMVCRKALALLRHSASLPDAIFLIRDDDRDAQRRRGLAQARSEAQAKHGMGAPIVIGLAHPKREAWVLNGFVPQTDGERQTIEELKRELDFRPDEQPQKLNGKDGEPRDIKRVVSKLTNGDPQREAACWCEANIEQLKQRGTETGLAQYLQEVEEKIVPLFANAASAGQ